ncbi:MAG TPA: hypothetical protein VHB69_00445 [Mycobacteriales bacterium]|nr:hypothetical protein [Mycobacteriales bacterium]
MPASGFQRIKDGATITLAPDADDAFKITVERNGTTVTAQEGNAMLDDPAAIATVVDGMYDDLLSAEHDRA